MRRRGRDKDKGREYIMGTHEDGYTADVEGAIGDVLVGNPI